MTIKTSSMNISDKINRRSLFKGLTAGAVASSLPVSSGQAAGQDAVKRGVSKGRINQSVVSWCFANHWSVEETCRQAKRLGCKSVELIDSKNWPVLKKHGLTCAISESR